MNERQRDRDKEKLGERGLMRQEAQYKSGGTSKDRAREKTKETRRDMEKGEGARMEKRRQGRVWIGKNRIAGGIAVVGRQSFGEKQQRYISGDESDSDVGAYGLSVCSRSPLSFYLMQRPTTTFDSQVFYTCRSSLPMFWGSANKLRFVTHRTTQVENPATSHIWRRRQAEYFNNNKVTLDFCQYGTPYRKRTTLATNTDFKPRPLCDPKYCPACPNGKSHDKSAQRGPSKGKNYKLDRCSLDELHAYPTDLCKDIYKYVSKELVWEIV